MIDKRILETILSDQLEELVMKHSMRFCRRKEEDLVDLKSPQAQIVIGVRRSGKSTLCYNVLHRAGVKYAYVNFDDERLAELKGARIYCCLQTINTKISNKMDTLSLSARCMTGCCKNL